MKKILTLILLITTLSVQSQNLVKDRLNSKRIDKRVVVNFAGDLLTPRYSIDDKDYRIDDYGWYNEFNKRTTFAINDETANLQIRFLNPLRFRVKITTKEMDDPLATATDTLISSIKELAGLMTSKSDFEKLFILKTTEEKIVINIATKELSSMSGVTQNSIEDSPSKMTKINKVVTGFISTSAAALKSARVRSVLGLASPVALARALGLTPAQLILFIDTIADEIILIEIFNKNALKEIKSSMLLEWVMWAEENVECFKEKKMIELFDEVIKNEEKIYTGGEAFEDAIKKDFNEILKQDKVSDFKKAINDAKNKIPSLDKAIKENIESLNALDNVSYYQDCSSTFDLYSKARMLSYISYSKRIYNKRLSVLKGFGDLCDELLKYVKDADEERNTVLVESLKTTEKKINQVTLSVQKIEWEEYKGTISWKFKVKSSNEISKATFNVVPYASVLTEFGVGVLYFFSPLEFPRYGIVTNKDGKNVVAQTGTNLLNYLPSPTVTFLPRWGKGDVFWQFQVGVSLANNQPVFHFGGGLRLFSLNNTFVSSISIMSGVAFNFVKSLNTLAIGSEATIDTLNSDLKTKLQGPAHPYLGLQFNF